MDLHSINLDDGYKSIAYGKLTAVLIEAMMQEMVATLITEKEIGYEKNF